MQRLLGNYGIVIAILALYALFVLIHLTARLGALNSFNSCPSFRITNYWLLIAVGFLVGGFTLINRFGTSNSATSYCGAVALTDCERSISNHGLRH